MFEGLPEVCYGTLLSNGDTVKIKKGEMGYYRVPDELRTMHPDILNESIGVTKAQAEAMMAGSMFGWDVPGANPEMWVDIISKKKA